MAKTHFISNKFIKSLQSLIPYKELELTPDIDELNPNYKAFNDTGVRRTDVLLNHSILYGQDRNDALQGYVNGYNSNTTYANIQPDKAARIRDYRVMAAYSEVANALDEICDELINIDIDGNIFKLDIIESDKITPQMSKTLEEEFKKFIQIFNFEDEGWIIGRKLLTEGEVYYEHIISEEHPELGILGVLPLPSELIEPTYDNVQNYNIKGYILQKPKLDPNDPTKVEKIEYVPIDKNQVTYINSGIWNQDKTYRLPFIENARKAYRQLTLIEDSIVIYRLARAPERLVFKVDVGNMSTPDAEAYVKKLMHQFWSKKTFDVDQNGLYTKFDPQSMLDDFWFPIRTGSTGTTVEKLQGGASLDKLEDLLYFQKKLYEALKVPTNRLNKESTQQVSPQELLKEELKFANFIVRIQRGISNSIKSTFITHLQLRGIWDKLKIKEQYFRLKMNVPTNFYDLRESQRMELKMKNFGDAVQTQQISPSLAAKKYLGWTDEMIKANREWLRKDKAFEWELAQITNAGPEWRTAQAVAAGGIEGAAGGGAGGAGPVSDLGGLAGGAPEGFGGAAAPEAGGAADIGGGEAQPTIPDNM